MVQRVLEHPHKFARTRRNVIKIDHVIKQREFCDGQDDDSNVAARHWLVV